MRPSLVLRRHMARYRPTPRLHFRHGLRLDLDLPHRADIEGYTHWGEAYHGYWTADPTRLNAHFGSATDLKALSTVLHTQGMYMMVDVVINHMATTQDHSTFEPDGTYGPFSSADGFHRPFCFVD